MQRLRFHIAKVFLGRVSLLFFALIFAHSVSLAGLPVRHLVGPQDTPYSLVSGGLCPFVYSTTIGAVCGLNQYPGLSGATIDFGIIGKFDVDAYEDFRIIEKKPDEERIQRIFRERKFNSASGVVSLTSYFNRTHISFVPLRLVQAYYITNPVFPEVHYVRALDNMLAVQHTFEFGTGRLHDDFRPGSIKLGVMPSVSQRKRTHLDADLSDILVKKDLQKTKTTVHYDMNATLRYQPGTPWFRGVTLGVRNLRGGRACRECDEPLLDIDSDSRMLFHASADIGGSFPVGAFILGAGVESQVEVDAKTPVKFNATAIYKLTSFGFYSSFSETISRVGFLYEGQFYRSGIIYTNEKQVNPLRFERKNEAFVVLGCAL
jgi:hypothetical protein